MRNFFLKILSIILIFSILFTSTYASNDNSWINIDNYKVISIVQTESWPMYYISSKYSDRNVWDVADILMAWWSWKDFFDEPSFWNFWWAVLDTASLLPLLPSSAYFRKWWKTFIKQDELKKFAKTKNWKEAIKKNLKVKTVKVSENAEKKLNYIFWLATWDAHNIDRSKSMLNLLKSIWIHDTPSWRKKILEQINIQLNNPFSIRKFIRKNWVLITVREMLLVWPWGFAKMETHWVTWTTTLTTIVIYK